LDFKAFGEWLQTHRERLGLTQQELAEKLGYTKNYISTLERAVPHSKSRSQSKPSESLVSKLAETFGVSLSEARLMAGYSPVTSELDSDQVFAEEIASMVRRIPSGRREIYKQKLRQDAHFLAALVVDAA